MTFRKNKTCLKNNKFFIFSMTFLIFLLFFLIYYPGIITYDGNYQWNEVLTGALTNFHPFISTYFMYLLSFIYKSPSIVILFQLIVISITFTKLYSMYNTGKKWSKWIVYLMLITFPIISVYAVTLWKDILYSYYLLNSGIIIYEWAKEDFRPDFKNKYLLILLLSLVFAYRVNGMIVAVLLLIIVLIKLILKKQKIIHIIVLPIIFISIICVFLTIRESYLKKLPQDNAPRTSTLDNYFIWITGTYLNNGNVTEKEYEFLSNICDIETWKQAYNPYLINASNLMEKNEEFVENNRKEFHNIFINMTKRNIGLFVIHYLKADSLLISPIVIGYVYTYDFSNMGRIYSFVDKTQPIIPYVHRVNDVYLNATLRLPIVKHIYTPANIMYISIGLVLFLVIKSKDKKYLWVLAPMMCNIISLLPVNLAQDLRYVYINYLTLVFVIVLFINYKNVKLESKK